MTEIVAVLLTTLILGYHWSRDHIKLTRERDVARSMVHPSRRHLAAVPDACPTPCAPCGSHADCWRDA